MEEIVSTLHGKLKVTENSDELITITRLGSYLPLIFFSRQELWEFIDQLARVVPPPKHNDISQRYIGDVGRFDVT